MEWLITKLTGCQPRSDDLRWAVDRGHREVDQRRADDVTEPEAKTF